MDGRDRGLQRVRPRRAAQRQGAVDERERLADRAAVPARPVLGLEQDELAAGPDPRRAPGVVQEHEREQARRLRLVRQQHVHHAREADRLGGEVVAHEGVARRRGVALVEHEVEHGEDGPEAVLERLGRRLGQRDARQAHLLLGPHEPLRHRRLGEEQRPRDLRHGEAADQPQGQRDLRLERERRVAAREHEAEPFVGDHLGVLAGQVAHRLLELAHEQRLLLAQGRLAPQPVDRAPLRGREDPRRRGGRDAVARPAVQRDGVGVLHGLLGAVDVAAQPAGEDRHRAPELRAEAAGDRVGRRAAGGIAQA